MREKSFVTLFYYLPNFVLKKDVGMIPYILQEQYEYRSVIVSNKSGMDTYSELDNEMSNLNITFLGNGEKYFFLRAIKYLLQNAKKIDVLNMYHLKISTGVLLALYRALNHRGITYLKLDIDFLFFEKKSSRIWWKKLIYTRILQKANICSAESSKICKKVEEYCGKKIELIPNGIYVFPDIDTDISLYEKERVEQIIKNCNSRRIIFTAGRIGTRQKNNEMLIEGFLKSGLYSRYCLLLAGTVENEFKEWYNDLSTIHSELSKCIFFIGNINNKEALNRLYEVADIFVLSSRWEGFPLVIPEAMLQECFLILTNVIYPAYDIIKNDNFGKIINTESVIDLANALKYYDDNRENIIQHKSEISEFCKENYMWENICKRLNDLINTQITLMEK
ncbi:MAG: glycosyltransferase family 4 protein [Lachnospiraceae bacterium]|nr:glycosyltransferase family 4 protein [Lachnospiraceae bacterium]